MARSTWSVQKKIAGVWTADSTLYRPNSDLEIAQVSTQKKMKLAEGNPAYFTPATEVDYQRLTFVWLADDGSMKTKITDYMDNQDDVKIIDNNATEYVGRFVDIRSKWIVGVSPDEYDVTAIFEQMSSLA